MMAHKRALLSSKGISAFGLGGYPDSDEVELIPTVAGQCRTFTILLGSMITGFPLAAFASGLKATYAEYLVCMLEYSPGTSYGSRIKIAGAWRSAVLASGKYLLVVLVVSHNCRSGWQGQGIPLVHFISSNIISRL